MIESYNIICFAPGDWWTMNPSCTTHIMKILSAKNRILYINPFSSDIAAAEKRGLLTRIIRKTKSIFKCIRNPQKNLYVFSPIFLPFQNNAFFDILNNIFLWIQIKSACLILRMSKPVLWMENLRAADMIDWFSPLLVIYHVSDLFEHTEYTQRNKKLLNREKMLTLKSDLLICVSQSLFFEKATQRTNVHYLPHGVDFDFFQQSSNDGRLEMIKNIPHPIAGYYGTLTAANDIELLEYCAKKLPHISFVLAGEVTGGDYTTLQNLKNVYLPGKIPYEDIPALCEEFDICLLNWKMDKWIKYCNPLKLLEYMSLGKPIVSVPIDEVVTNYSDIISIASSKEQFCKAIISELRNDNENRKVKRIKIAKSHSWQNHIQKLSLIIDESITEKYQRISELHLCSNE